MKKLLLPFFILVMCGMLNIVLAQSSKLDAYERHIDDRQGSAEDIAYIDQHPNLAALNSTKAQEEPKPVLASLKGDFGGGEGTEELPFLISTPEHLDAIRSLTGSAYGHLHFKQTADIDLGVAPWNEGEGWEPIPNFYGNYNGDGKTISGLYINRPTQDFVGLFGRALEASFTNISLEDVDVTGSWRVGGLVGQATSNCFISNCSVSGEVSGHLFPGGIAGNLYYGSSIENSYSTANIFLTGDDGQQAGGLIGRLLEGHIHSCYSTGNVSGVAGNFFGGLVAIASNESTISNSYSTGSVEGSNIAGGLVGSFENSSLTNSYSTGSVTSSGTSGGMIGRVIDATISSSYWNNETSAQIVSAGGQVKTTAEMVQQSTFEGWDFTSTWDINPDNSYPYLQWQGEPDDFNQPIGTVPPHNLEASPDNTEITLSWQAPSIGTPTGFKIYRDGDAIETVASSQLTYTDDGLTNYEYYTYHVTALYTDFESNPSNPVTTFPTAGFSGGDGTAGNPYQVATPEELYTVRVYPTAHFIQVDDIDLGVAPWNQGEGWEPIGSLGSPFQGNYNGDGKTISNMTIIRGNTNRNGLFGHIEDASLNSIQMQDASIVGLNINGLLVGHAVSSIIVNCSAQGALTASIGYNGGLIGATTISSISNCFADVHVNAPETTYNGGLLGSIFESTLQNSYAAGNVTGSQFIGGLVGHVNESTIENTYSTGWVNGSASTDVGGLIGVVIESTVSSSYWNTETSIQQTSDGGEGKTTEQMAQQATFQGWDYASTWSINEGDTYPYLQWQDGPEGHNFVPDIYTLALVASPAGGGEVYAAGNYPEGAQVPIKTTLNPGFGFINWIDEDSNPVSEEMEFTFTMPASNVTLTANFEEYAPTDDMVLVFNTELGEGTTVTLPLYGNVDVTVDWGDDSAPQSIATEGNHDYTYAAEGTYTVTISGSLGQFGNAWDTYENAEKLTKVTSFGDLGLSSLSGAFRGAENLTEVPASLPATVTNVSHMFQEATSFNQDIGGWDVSNVHYMGGIFQNASSFNQDIGGWDVSIVFDMGYMLFGASAFNQDIGGWDVGNVENMFSLFGNATSFNQDISGWNVSNVNSMGNMFQSATSFNQDIGGWQVDNVQNMYGLFWNATSFNQDIGDWNVGNVQNMFAMFYNATSFNQDIGDWDVSSVSDMQHMFGLATSFNQDIGNWYVSSVLYMNGMFNNVTLSTANYNSILLGWSQLTLQDDVDFHAGNSKYSVGTPATARQSIIDDFNWSITDGGEADYFTISASIDPENTGTITGSGDYDHGATVTLTATANEGYTFVNWTENDAEVSTDAEYTFTATDDRTLVANFSLNNYTISASVDPENTGTITGSGDYDHGASVTLTATANEGYTFVNWTENDTEVSTDAEYTFTATDDRTLVANFEQPTSINRIVLSQLAVYPNPFSNSITLENAEGVNRVIITSLTGQRVMDITLNGQIQINTSHLVKGIYMVEFQSNNGDRVVKRMVKY